MSFDKIFDLTAGVYTFITFNDHSGITAQHILRAAAAWASYLWQPALGRGLALTAALDPIAGCRVPALFKRATEKGRLSLTYRK